MTYQQVIDALEHMVKTGLREPGEPFTVAGDYIEYIQDGRTGEIVWNGTKEVEINIPPLKL
jgi:hypothetical protein